MPPQNERIVFDPRIAVGKPVIRRTRLAVETVVGLLADGWTEAEVLQEYPVLSHEDVSACLGYARDLLRSERVYPSPA